MRRRAIAGVTTLALVVALFGCVPGASGGGNFHTYQTDAETLYRAVEDITAELDGKTFNLNTAEFKAYSRLVTAFESKPSSVGVSFYLDDVFVGTLPIEGVEGRITSEFRGVANGETQVSFSVRDPDRPQGTSEERSEQRRAAVFGRRFVDEIVSRLDAQFTRL